jgi:uncharacterized membrane protein YkoI
MKRSIVMKNKTKFLTVLATAFVLVTAFVLAFNASTISPVFAAPAISSDSVQEIAYADADIAKSDISAIDELVRFRSEDGYYYNFVFRTSSIKYVYKINAATGTVVESVAYALGKPGTQNGNTILISREEAQEIVYTDAGVTKSDVSVIDELVLFRSGDGYYYNFVFRTSSTKYVYKINAATGAVVESVVYALNGNTILISRDEALKIAISKSGVSVNSLKKQEVELDSKKGIYYYEVKLKTTSGVKYEYDIDAETGAIIDI